MESAYTRSRTLSKRTAQTTTTKTYYNTLTRSTTGPLREDTGWDARCGKSAPSSATGAGSAERSQVATWEPESEIHDNFIDKYEASMEAEAELEAELAAQDEEEDEED